MINIGREHDTLIPSRLLEEGAVCASCDTAEAVYFCKRCDSTSGCIRCMTHQHRLSDVHALIRIDDHRDRFLTTQSDSLKAHEPTVYTELEINGENSCEVESVDADTTDDDELEMMPVHASPPIRSRFVREATQLTGKRKRKPTNKTLEPNKRRRVCE